MKSIYPKESKAILFLLTNEEKLAEEILSEFERHLGPVEMRSDWHSFPKSHYYEEEMGPNLKRRLIGFKNIFEPHRLVELKQLATTIENQFSHDACRMSHDVQQRSINIDPGYVDLFKVVLASGKAGGQKVALSAEVYSCTLLRFEKGKWIPFDWSFPDFKEATYHDDLLKIRGNLKRNLLTADG